MAAKSKKKKPSKPERIAKATAGLIYDSYREFRDDPHTSGKQYEGRLGLSEPLKLKKHGKLRLLIREHLEKKGFRVTVLVVGRKDDMDTVHFIISRNDH